MVSPYSEEEIEKALLYIKPMRPVNTVHPEIVPPEMISYLVDKELIRHVPVIEQNRVEFWLTQTGRYFIARRKQS